MLDDPLLKLMLIMVDLMIGSGYKVTEICHSLGVSRSTLCQRMKENNMVLDKFTDISDVDLDEHISLFKADHLNCGLPLVQGHLVSIGVRVPRRIRETLQHLDSIGTRNRWHQITKRRVYKLPGPNSLWHIDGHHSLIRWRMVIHGGIDGYSRLIVLLNCPTNNRSETVFKLFYEAIKTYNVPSRVRSDKGGENVRVCEFMVAYRGVGRGSHIAGSSIHNQRIERLWRDVFRCVCTSYYTLFYDMEVNGILDLNCETDLFVLHYLFIPQINQSLDTFVQAWNNHAIRTERNWNPLKIWSRGVLDPSNIGQTAVRDIVDDIPLDSVNSFGFDFVGESNEIQLTRMQTLLMYL